MRGRGLKLKFLFRKPSSEFVAPHAGAWIETPHDFVFEQFNKVAPHAGAWIETSLAHETTEGVTVAPHAGAWIETDI